MRKVCYRIACAVFKAKINFQQNIKPYQVLCLYRERDEQHHQVHIRIKHTEGILYAEYSTGSADKGCMINAVKVLGLARLHPAGNDQLIKEVFIRGIYGKCPDQVVNLNCLYKHLQYSGAYTADKIKVKETNQADGILQDRAERKQRKHIKKDMLETAMHKHVGDKLPGPERGRVKIIFAEQGGYRSPRRTMVEQHISKKKYDINYQQVFYNRR